MMAFRCIYCAEKKPESERTIEHVWPSAMGGGKLPNKFQINQCCARCNNNLGSFVDGAFYHEFMVYHDHQMPHLGFLSPPEPKFIPSHYMGRLIESPLSDRTIEHWAGPRGENICFVHENDRDEFQYVAKGDPIQRTTDPGRVYFALTKPETYWFWIALNSIQKTFRNAQIHCLTEIGDDTGDAVVGKVFDAIRDRTSLPNDELDYFSKKVGSNSWVKNHLSIDLGLCSRFASKFAIGLGFVYFGEDFFQHRQYEDLKESMRRSSIPLEKRPNKIARYVLATEGDSILPSTPAGTRIQLVQLPIGLCANVVFPSGNQIYTLLDGKSSLGSNQMCGENFLITPAEDEAIAFTQDEVLSSIPNMKPQRMIDLENRMRSADEIDRQVEQLEKDAIARS